MDEGAMKTGGPVVVNLCDPTHAKQKLSGLSVVSCLKTAVAESKEDQESRRSSTAAAGKNLWDDSVEINLAVSDKMSCSFCDVEFGDRQEQVTHYKSDFHRFNLKQRLRGAPPISEECFEDIADNISSSLSGSDSSSDEESQADTDQDGKNPTIPVTDAAEATEGFSVSSGRTPLVYFKNGEGELLSMYRCVLHGKKNIPETDTELITMAEASPINPVWAILMVAGGHFAAAVFNCEEIVEHKTFHRYTVRAKRGTAQGLRDSQGNAPKSAGASLRRYNEVSLIQEAQDLLQSWSEQLKKCSVIFLRAPSYNRALFFSHKNPPFDKNDARIRMIPFATRRPTFSEVKRVHGVLSSVMNYGPAGEVDLDLIKSPTHQKRTGTPRKQSAATDVSTKQTSKELDLAEPAKDEEDSESEGEIDLRTVKEILTTVDLKMFEITRKPKRKKKKKKKEEKVDEGFDDLGDLDADVEPEDNEEVAMVTKNPAFAEVEQIQNILYTASRTGNLKLLEDSLKDLEDYTKRNHMDISPNATEEGVEDGTAGSTAGSNQAFSDDNDVRTCGDNNSGPEDDKSLGDMKVNNLKNGTAEFLTILNRTFGAKKETVLHVSARMGKVEILSALLEAGADPCVRNGNKLPPYATASTKEARNAFRRFMGKNPDRYDYVAAQVPAPLTEEMEAERKAKDSERKKLAKKAKQERLKEVRAKEAEKEAEEREKKRYLNLSDREKRALAAEKRLVKQAEETTGTRPVLSRCWQCGTDITGMVPFEYFDYKFCSPKCLKMHRTATQLKRS